jgi:hypothetical protein
MTIWDRGRWYPDRTVRHLISTGYLSLESSEAAAYVAFALEAWISDNVT